MKKKSWNMGMKHLVSKNFTDMEDMFKPAFGLPPVHFDAGLDDHGNPLINTE
jgi:hypothetical protein